MCLKDETFYVHIKSSDAIVNDSDKQFMYQLGTVYDNCPQLQRFGDAGYAFVRVNYFATDQDWINTNHTVCIHMSNTMPNSLESRSLANGAYRNFASTNIIGYVPTNETNMKYADNSFENHLVKCSNPFSGDTMLRFTYDTGEEVQFTNKTWLLSLAITFADDKVDYQTNRSKSAPFDGLC